jgi:hypothetical protein
LKKHGANVFRVVDSLVAKLNIDLEAAKKMLVDLGRRHIKYGAKVEYISVNIFFIKSEIKKIK